jgi:hypothetical protein
MTLVVKMSATLLLSSATERKTWALRPRKHGNSTFQEPVGTPESGSSDPHFQAKPRCAANRRRRRVSGTEANNYASPSKETRSVLRDSVHTRHRAVYRSTQELLDRLIERRKRAWKLERC